MLNANSALLIVVSTKISLPPISRHHLRTVQPPITSMSYCILLITSVFSLRKILTSTSFTISCSFLVIFCVLYKLIPLELPRHPSLLFNLVLVGMVTKEGSLKTIFTYLIWLKTHCEGKVEGKMKHPIFILFWFTALCSSIFIYCKWVLFWE